jgi:probable F420-dependent oxidoreductase
VATVELGEELGYDAVALPEHLLPPAWPDAPAHTKVWHDQVALASFLAARTTRLRLLTSVLVVPYHPPVQLAKALATLDLLSGGRIRLGVGEGWMRAEFRRLGIPFEERGAITDEYLRAMRELWTAERPSFSGRYVSFDDVSFLPRPGHIPIYVGGSGAGPFRRIAELGDGWLPLPTTPEEIAAGRLQIRHLLELRGRDPDSLWIGASLRAGGDPETERMTAHVVGGGRDPSRGGRVPAGECLCAIEELRAAGANHVSVAFAWRTGDELREELRWFAADVIPQS